MTKTATALLLALFQASFFSPPARADGFALDALSAAEVPLLSPPLDLSPAAAKARFDHAGLPCHLFSEETALGPVLVRAISAVNSTLDVALYNLQLSEVVNALVAARDRGVRVRVILDEKRVFPKRNADIQRLLDAGMAVRVMNGRGRSGAMHNKFAVLDGALLINGAHNWSATAENTNAENTIFTAEPYYIQVFGAEFDRLFAGAKRP